MRSSYLVFLLIPVLIAGLGCSSGGSDFANQSPTVPIIQQNNISSLSGDRLWGLYEVTVDTVTETAEIVPMRTAMIEANIIKFLDNKSGDPNITISDLELDKPKVNLTVGIRHPFPSTPKYTGFMVRGIILTNGTRQDFEDQDLVMSTNEQLRVVNCDGFTRWWNPSEFPFNDTIRGYFPYSGGDPNGHFFSSTLNPHKLYADGLAPTAELSELDENMKSAFSAGALNSRRYELDFGNQPFIMFQFAVVASNDQPLHIPPEIPDDFPPGTIAAEPWYINPYQVSNTLYDDGIDSGGELQLRVDIKDFENAELDQVFVEAPGHFPRQQLSFAEQDGTLFSFESWITNITIPNTDTFDVLVTAVAPDGEGYDSLLPGKESAMYKLMTVDVGTEPPPPPPKDCPDFPFYDDFEPNSECVWTPHGGDYWGVAGGYLDAKGGGTCYEENTGSQNENPNLSYVSSPVISVPESELDLEITINHTIDVDPPEPLGYWAWDACFVRINGELIYPTYGPPYEPASYPLSFDDYPCWTSNYNWMTSRFNVGTAYNGTDIEIEFVLDTFDYIDNCNPPFFGWLIDEVTVDFVE
ncbi:MAG TPA: hypothetical protein VGB30_03955 [bacterium]